MCSWLETTTWTSPIFRSMICGLRSRAGKEQTEEEGRRKEGNGKLNGSCGGVLGGRGEPQNR